MMCDDCGIRPATIRLMSIADGEKVTRNLCAHCLAEGKKDLPNLDMGALDGIIASLLAATQKMGIAKKSKIDLTCPDCGTTYQEFENTGMLGCVGCYQAFREPLSALLQRVHGHNNHVGRRPGHDPEQIKQKVDIYQLKIALQQAIKEEAYEQAVVLRDQIKALSAEQDLPKEVPNDCL